MNLITAEQRIQLLANGTAACRGYDYDPVVKLFTPDGAATWLLTELDAEADEDIAFGLCDLGVGCPELGYVSLAELRALRGQLGLPAERDLTFTADKPLSAYAEAAWLAGRIVA